MNSFQGNISALLNVGSMELQAWCKARDIPCQRYSNSTVKKVVAGKGGVKKQEIYKHVVQFMTEASRKLPHPPKSQTGAGYDVADAHAIAHTALAKHLEGGITKKKR